MTASSPSRPAIWPWLMLAMAVFLIDQWTKALIIDHYRLHDYTVITGFFNLGRWHNPGAAFSFLGDASGWQRWLFTGIGITAGAFIVWMLHKHRGQRLFSFAVTMILGGAVGNVVDRMMHGHVIDFLDFHWGGRHFPAFNLADSAITLGAICLIVDELLRMRRSRQESA